MKGPFLFTLSLFPVSFSADGSMMHPQNRQIAFLDATHLLNSSEIVARSLALAVAGLVGILYPADLEILVQIVIVFPALRRDFVQLEAAQVTVPYDMSSFHSLGELVAC